MVKFEILVANPIGKITILPDVPCGQFALGTLTETCFEDVVFEVNITHQI